MIIHDVEQQTEAWYSLRCGIASASNFAKIVTSKGIGATGETRKKYLYQLAAESITGEKEQSYTNAAMQHGIDTEPKAREMYEFMRECKVQEVGFCMADGGRYGVSPDGFVGLDGLIEIKCPLAQTHVKYILDNKLPTTYFQQVQGQLFVTERDWCDFMSYVPKMRPFITRVYPDLEFHKKLEKELDKFCDELVILINKIKGE